MFGIEFESMLKHCEVHVALAASCLVYIIFDRVYLFMPYVS